MKKGRVPIIKYIDEKAYERDEKTCSKTLDLTKCFDSDPDSVNLDPQHQCFGSGSRTPVFRIRIQINSNFVKEGKNSILIINNILFLFLSLYEVLSTTGEASSPPNT
jgi:hypothetical protein